MQSTQSFDPEFVLAQLDGDVHLDSNVADFGCGAGFFSIPCAQKYSGTVHCFDVLEGALESVQSKAKTFGLRNIVANHVNLEVDNATNLDDQSVQLVIARNIFWQNNDASKLLTEAHRILSEDGRLLVVTLSGEQKKPGMPDQAYTVDEVIDKDLTDNGFVIEERSQVDAHHHMIIAKHA